MKQKKKKIITEKKYWNLEQNSLTIFNNIKGKMHEID